MTQPRYKYPRTPHLPWSPGASSDDVHLDVLAQFEGKEVVVTEKLDGENTTMYADHLHARSIDSRHHPSRDWVKHFHGTIAYQLPDGWRLCGENVYAKHSIAYDQLESYFYMFSIWDETNHCLDWDQTEEWAALLGCALPPIMYRGIWDQKLIQALSFDTNTCEGYVVRSVEGFAYEDFSSHIAKWVRKGHVQTDKHWMHQSVVPNQLRAQEGDAGGE